MSICSELWSYLNSFMREFNGAKYRCIDFKSSVSQKAKRLRSCARARGKNIQPLTKHRTVVMKGSGLGDINTSKVLISPRKRGGVFELFLWTIPTS